METLQAALLGLVQGLTEFLPVSSSGHLVIVQHLTGMKNSALFFDVSLHVGTLIAVLLVFRRDIFRILTASSRFLVSLLNGASTFSEVQRDPELRMSLLILIGIIPTGIIGLLFHHVADTLFSSASIVGGMLIVTGFMLWATRWVPATGVDINRFSGRNAFVIGVLQGLSVLPGISRSGTTIAGGLFLGLERETAARFSFLISVPAIIGAEFLTLRDALVNPVIHYRITLLGTLISFAAGYFALKLLLAVVKQGRLFVFAPYCWLMGAVILAWSL